jgi:hypothetical protein
MMLQPAMRSNRLNALVAESPIDPQAICSKAGVILEAVLDWPQILAATWTLLACL